MTDHRTALARDMPRVVPAAELLTSTVAAAAVAVAQSVKWPDRAGDSREGDPVTHDPALPAAHPARRPSVAALLTSAVPLAVAAAALAAAPLAAAIPVAAPAGAQHAAAALPAAAAPAAHAGALNVKYPDAAGD